MDVTGSQGVQLGEYGNVQINLFTGQRPAGPVVAGNVPSPRLGFRAPRDSMTALSGNRPGVSAAASSLDRVASARPSSPPPTPATAARPAGDSSPGSTPRPPPPLDGLAVVADRLGIERRRPGRARPRGPQPAEAIVTLIVFDNVIIPSLHAASTVPSMGDTQVLITSTEVSVTALGNPVQVEIFTEKRPSPSSPPAPASTTKSAPACSRSNSAISRSPSPRPPPSSPPADLLRLPGPAAGLPG